MAFDCTADNQFLYRRLVSPQTTRVAHETELTMADESSAEALAEQLSQFAQELESSELVSTTASASTRPHHQQASAATTMDAASSTKTKRQLTRIELVKLIVTMQEIQNVQMDRLEALVADMDGDDDSSKENTQPAPLPRMTSPPLAGRRAPTTKSNHSQQRHWSVGRPLETLMEADHEESADNTTASLGATLQTLSRMPQKGATTVSTTTMSPSLLPFSESTEQQAQSRRTANQSSKEQHQPPTSHDHDNPVMMQSEERSLRQSLAQDATQETACSYEQTHKEATDDNDDEEEEATPDRRSLQYSKADNDDDDSAMEMDDSALYCPTLIASERKQQQRQQQHLSHFHGMPSHLPSPSTPMDPRRISHVRINLDAASPAPTALTVDDSYWNSNSLLEHDVQSVASEETPVLYRYRVGRDDYSPHGNGVSVLPNQRGVHTAQKKKMATAAHSNNNCRLRKTVTINTPIGNNNSFAPASATKQVFRKTPFRPTRLMMPSTPTIDENAPLYEQASLIGHDLLDQYDLDDESLLHSPSETTPKQGAAADATHGKDTETLLADRLDSTQHEFASPVGIDISFSNSKQSARSHYSLPASLADAVGAENSDKDDAAATADSLRRHSAKANLASTSHTPPAPNTPLLSKDRRFSALSQSYYNARRIQPVSQEDYNNAPRIVQMQVTFAEVEASIRLLNEALEMRLLTWQFPEARAKLVLKPLSFSQRKCKTVMMSLCHWQRLIMRRLSQIGGGSTNDSGAEQLGLYFEVA